MLTYTHIASLFFDVVLKEVTTRESHILLYVIVPADVQMYLREREHQHFRLILQIDDNYNEEGEQKVLEGDSYKESM